MTLMELFGFEQSDLDANRRGELTDRQRRMLQRSETVGTAAAGGSVIVYLIAVVVIVAAYAGTGGFGLPQPYGLIFLAAALLLLAGAVLNNLRRQRRSLTQYGHNIREQRIEVIRGPAAVVYDSHYGTTGVGGYSLAIGGRSPLVSVKEGDQLPRVFTADRTYTAYCIDNGAGDPYLLSVEESS